MSAGGWIGVGLALLLALGLLVAGGVLLARISRPVPVTPGRSAPPRHPARRQPEAERVHPMSRKPGRGSISTPLDSDDA